MHSLLSEGQESSRLIILDITRYPIEIRNFLLFLLSRQMETISSEINIL